MKPVRKWFESKTIWFNLLGLVVVVLQYTQTIHVGDPKMLESALLVANLLLRMVTTGSIEKSLT